MPIRTILVKILGLCLMPSGPNRPNSKKCLLYCPDVHWVMGAQPDGQSGRDGLTGEVVSHSRPTVSATAALSSMALVVLPCFAYFFPSICFIFCLFFSPQYFSFALLSIRSGDSQKIILPENLSCVV
jgi:hypothetical protein